MFLINLRGTKRELEVSQNHPEQIKIYPLGQTERTLARKELGIVMQLRQVINFREFAEKQATEALYDMEKIIHEILQTRRDARR